MSILQSVHHPFILIPDGDADCNGKIGLEEAIYALQVVAGLRTLLCMYSILPVNKSVESTDYAARAGSATAFSNGGITYTSSTPVDPNLNVIGWYSGNSAVTYSPNSSGKGSHPVAQKQANVKEIHLIPNRFQTHLTPRTPSLKGKGETSSALPSPFRGGSGGGVL